MIVITRDRDQEIVIETPQGVIRFKYFGSEQGHRNRATVGVSAPREFPVYRGEKEGASRTDEPSENETSATAGREMPDRR